MKVLSRLTAIAVTVAALFAGAGAAFAGLGQPTPWQMGMQDAATPVMEDIASFHDFLLWIITRSRSSYWSCCWSSCFASMRAANPTPTRTTHNTPA